MSAPAFLRPRQIAEFLSVTERTVRRWIADGTVPSVRLGGARLVPVADLERRLGAPFDPPEEDEEDVI